MPELPAEPFGRSSLQRSVNAEVLEPTHEREADRSQSCPSAVGVPDIKRHACESAVLEAGYGVLHVGAAAHQAVEPGRVAGLVSEDSSVAQMVDGEQDPLSTGRARLAAHQRRLPPNR